MSYTQDILEPGIVYHIYNRATGDEKLFRQDKNYQFFLDKVSKYVEPVGDIFAYCLMPNHFHLLLRIKGGVFGSPYNNMEVKPGKAMANLCSSYTQAYNKLYGRKGSLFMKNFGRLRVTDDSYFKKLVHYIHGNPVIAGLVEHPKNWRYSSYNALVSSGETKLHRNELLEYFGNRDNFIYYHNSMLPEEL